MDTLPSMLERDRILLPHPPSSDSNGSGGGSSSSSSSSGGGSGSSSSSSSGGGGSSSSSSSGGTTTSTTESSSSSSAGTSFYSSGAAHITLFTFALTAVGAAFYLLLARRRRRSLQKKKPKIDGTQLMPIDTAPSSGSTLTFDNISQQSSYIDIELAPSMNFHPLGGGIYLLNQSHEEQEDHTSAEGNTWKPDDDINVYLPPKRPTHSEDENADMSSMTDEFNSSTHSEDEPALFNPDSQGSAVPPSTICSICFKEEFGAMKACECGRPICNKQAHLLCVQKINPGPSVAHPGTPAPRLPTVLCSGGTQYCTTTALQHQHQQQQQQQEENHSSRSQVSAHTVY